MPETATIVYATEELMPSLFGSMRLRVDRDSVDLSRLSSPSGLAFLAGHDGDAPLGKITRAEIHDGVAYAYVRLESTTRSEPFLEELRQGIRDGISPGFMILAAEFVEEDERRGHGGYPLAALRGIQHPDPEDDGRKPTQYRRQSVQQQSLKRGRCVPVSTCPLERHAARRYLFLISRLMLARPLKNGSHTPGRARVTEPTKTAAERRKKMSEIERELMRNWPT